MPTSSNQYALEGSNKRDASHMLNCCSQNMRHRRGFGEPSQLISIAEIRELLLCTIQSTQPKTSHRVGQKQLFYQRIFFIKMVVQEHGGESSPSSIRTLEELRSGSGDVSSGSWQLYVCVRYLEIL